MIKLYGYFRSSAAYRIRIAMNLKGIEYADGFVHLRKNEQSDEAFRALNPQGLVPVLEDEDTVISQSIAILEYLDEKYPTPPFLPKNTVDRAYVRSIALAVACDIHPLNNLRVLRYLDYNLNLEEEQRNGWYRHWIAIEFRAMETKISTARRYGRFCFGNTPGIADICLVPQVANARRFNCDLSEYPILVDIDGNCREMEEFQRAAPENQPDAE